MTAKDRAAAKAKEVMSASYKGSGIGWNPHEMQLHLAKALEEWGQAEREAALEGAADLIENNPLNGAWRNTVAQGLRYLASKVKPDTSQKP